MDVLQKLHGRLDEHFGSLRHERDARAGGKPLFVLEHGLDSAEIAELRAGVCRVVAIGRASSKWWLPFVVYAAEIGYQYSGEEYWQTFEASTPGWVGYGDRNYIRTKFQEFARRFGGARPTGPWAGHFSIICWPITHAVLPTDLQIQLARLLYEYRHLLNAQLLATPDNLGEALALRAGRGSRRFQSFAQNTDLLGQVAAALLLNENEPSDLLLASTLARIVEDLSAQRQARRWLTDARRSANRVNLRGLSRVSSAAGASTRQPVAAPGQGLRVTDPKLMARRDGERWSIHIELPDLSPVAARFPDLQHVLRSSRCRLAGVSRPLARGQVMYSDQAFRLASWPGADAALLSLERSDPRYDELLADECRMSPGPSWIFRIVNSGVAEESRGKVLHPGRRYLMVSESPAGLPVWADRTAVACAGLYGYVFEVPTPLEPIHLDVLRGLGLGLASDVDVRPAGIVPAAWDGEGAAEWIVGELPDTRFVIHA